jgi:hypothetical protein
MNRSRLLGRVGVVAALVLASVGFAAVPANATVTGTNGAYTVSATGEPTALAVGQTATFTARVDFGSASVCSPGTLRVNVPVGAGYTGTSVPVSGTSGCGVNYTLSVTGVTAGTYTASVAYQYQKATIITTTWQIVVSAPDTTPPVVGIVSPEDGVTYWDGFVPAPIYGCTDDVAVGTCVQSGFSTAIGTHTMTVTGTDTSGNSASASVTYTVIPVPDTTPPVVTINGVADGATYPEGSVPAASCTAVDDRDGAIPCNVSGYGDTPGTWTVTGTATDAAGNTGTASATYTVEAVGPTYSFGGFYDPVDMGGVVNTVRAGRTVPLKFDLYADGVEVTDPALVSFSVAPSNVCAGATNTDPIEFTTTGGTSLRYDALTGQFIQNWKTPSAKGCYAVTATAGSASTTAYFLTK